MKKVIFLLLVFSCLVSCMKISVRNSELIPGVHFDQCHFGDSVFYTMNCTVENDGAKMQFSKKVIIPKDTIDMNVLNRVYHVRKDTVTTLVEDYGYSKESFKRMLLRKNNEKRDTTVFKFDANMYCTWKFFDEIYAAVAEW